MSPTNDGNDGNDGNDEGGTPARWHRGSYADAMIRVMSHLHARLDDDVEPAELAGVAGLSVFHFHRVFRAMVGQTVMQTVRTLRMERAAFRLRHGDAPVTQVALQSGYGSHEAFTRAFAAHFGVPPVQWREENRSGGEGPDIRIREERARRCVGVQHVGPYSDSAEAWRRLVGFRMATAPGRFPPRQLPLACVLDDPDITPPERCRLWAAWVLDDDEPDPEPLPPGFGRMDVPAGRYAVALHRGPYSTLGETYLGLLGVWVVRQAVRLTGDPVVEVYLNAPDTTPPAELLTEVCVRLA